MPAVGAALVRAGEVSIHLPGGSPEPEDASLYATLARQVFKENQVRVVLPRTWVLGGQASWVCPVCAGENGWGDRRVRSAGTRPRRGHSYRRLMTSLAAARHRPVRPPSSPGPLGWSRRGKLPAAASMARGVVAALGPSRHRVPDARDMLGCISGSSRRPDQRAERGNALRYGCGRFAWLARPGARSI